MTSDPGAAGFHATRWTLVRRAQGDSSEARAALAELCATYYQPVLVFVRCRSRSQDDAQELVQEFFARLLAKSSIAGAEPTRGKFRSFLLGALKHFISDLRDRERALKRGGQSEHVSMDSEEKPAAADELADAQTAPDDAVFDREWALTILARGVAVVEGELRDAGKEEVFSVLKAWLTGESGALSVTDAAERLHMSEGAVKVAVHRLRQRFRAAVRAEIAQTVDGDAAVAAEMNYLVEVLAR